MSFFLQVKKFNKKALEDTDTIRREIILRLFRAIVFDTPVLTGQLRGNWQTFVGRADTNPIDRSDKKHGRKVYQEIERVVKAAPKEEDILFVNNLPYAYRIEFEGWSHTKSPEGMVRRNALRLTTIARQVSRQYQKGGL